MPSVLNIGDLAIKIEQMEREISYLKSIIRTYPKGADSGKSVGSALQCISDGDGHYGMFRHITFHTSMFPDEWSESRPDPQQMCLRICYGVDNLGKVGEWWMGTRTMSDGIPRFLGKLGF